MKTKQKKESLAHMIVEGLKEAVAYAKGEITLRSNEVEFPDEAPLLAPEQIVALRERLGFSQAVFARCMNVAVKTVQAWEQGVRVPDGPAMRLMQLAKAQPALLSNMVHQRTDSRSALRKYLEHTARPAKRTAKASRHAPRSRNSFPK